jgi:hypothetical protein
MSLRKNQILKRLLEAASLPNKQNVYSTYTPVGAEVAEALDKTSIHNPFILGDIK